MNEDIRIRISRVLSVIGLILNIAVAIMGRTGNYYYRLKQQQKIWTQYLYFDIAGNRAVKHTLYIIKGCSGNKKIVY